MESILVMPKTGKLPDEFPLERKDISNFGDLFTIKIEAGDILAVGADLLAAYNKVIEFLPLQFVRLIGVPGADYDVAWDQATINYGEVSFTVLMEEWNKNPAEKEAVKKLADPYNIPTTKEAYRKDAPDFEDL